MPASCSSAHSKARVGVEDMDRLRLHFKPQSVSLSRARTGRQTRHYLGARTRQGRRQFISGADRIDWGKFSTNCSV